MSFAFSILQVLDLKESDLELKLILEMYRRESTDSRLENLIISFFFLVHISNLMYFSKTL
jgi:hypothetical protein